MILSFLRKRVTFHNVRKTMILFFFLFFFQITRIQNRNQENNSIFSTNSVRLKEEKNNKFIR